MTREPETIAELRRALGAQLATFRQAAELTQGRLARVAICDRTTIVHIEKGRARADERFWRAVDDACKAGGALVAAYLELEAAKAEHEQREREQRLASVRAKAAELRGRVSVDDQGWRPVWSGTDEPPTNRFLPEVVSRLSDAMLAAGARGPARQETAATVDTDVLTLPELTTRVKHAWQLRQQAAYGALGDHLAQLSDGLATETLLRAEQTAPEEVRFNPTTHSLVRTMLERERLSATPGLRGLARRIGIDQ